MPFTLARPPRKVTPPNYAAIVAEIGDKVWGPTWPAGMAHLIDASPKTLRRLRDAAAEGRDYRPAAEILGQLHAQLGGVVAALAPWAKHLHEGTAHD